jgi:dTDP-glucose 4,6-dehydratase
MQPKSLLVTGGAGFIGSTFVEMALSRGHRVVVMDALTYAGHAENLPSHDKCRLVVGSICDGPEVARLVGAEQVDAIVNFAAESHVDRSIDAPAAFIQTNVVGTFTLLNVAVAYWQAMPPEKRTTFRYLQVSTDEVYGSLGEDGKFSETCPMAPNSPYAASKAAGDHLTRAWNHTYGLPTITTNCSNNYGPRQYPEKLIPTLITCALAGRALPVYGNGGNTRDWIHVEDHCAGIFLALELGKVGETYCFGGDAARTNIHVARQICGILDRLRPRPDGGPYEKQIRFVTDRLGHDWRYAIDDARARTELGFTRRHDFEEGLARTVKWYLDNQNWCDLVLRGRK